MMKKHGIFFAALLIGALTLSSGCMPRLRTARQANGTSAALTAADAGTLILRVNPEISVGYNGEGLVTQIEGLNDDGTAILQGYGDYIGKDAKQVVRELVRRIGDAGYFVRDIDGDARSVTIQLSPGSSLPEDGFLEAIAADARRTVTEMQATNPVVDIGREDYDIRYAKASSPSPYITRDKAAQIALEHAGIDPANAVFDDREFDFAQGKAVYELEFISGGAEYEYDIDATTGQVLRHTREAAGYGAAGYGETYKTPTPTPTPTPAPIGTPAPAKTPSPAKTPRAGSHGSDYRRTDRDDWDDDDWDDGDWDDDWYDDDRDDDDRDYDDWD